MHSKDISSLTLKLDGTGYRGWFVALLLRKRVSPSLDCLKFAKYAGCGWYEIAKLFKLQSTDGHSPLSMGK
ncbi:hypothetical protein BGI32_10945 [Snodgrassella alvi]|uniref:Uncharacterized protein n=1 Tax=Snodgrassella alvi TaxID=1196083 RepID=A0A2N9WRE8_9NEIS|nr:hypothetical protein [Snodgrassella alvi]PIT12694.1 hypothetical protein BGI32_10945 [Snodgrassella alvi]